MKTTKQMERKDIQRMVRRGISWTLILIALSVSAGVNTQEKQMEAGQVRVQKWIRLPDGSYSGNRSSTLRCETEQFKRQLGKFLFGGRSCPILCRWDVGQLIIVCLAYCNGYTRTISYSRTEIASKEMSSMWNARKDISRIMASANLKKIEHCQRHNEPRVLNLRLEFLFVTELDLRKYYQERNSSFSLFWFVV